MSKYFICCDKCFSVIAKRNTTAARLWMDLCSMCGRSGDVILLRTQDFPELRILEILGYVLTTDLPASILVRVNGHCLDKDGQDCFCLNADGYSHD